MKCLRLLLVGATVWTYGSESLDTIIMRTEWDRFSEQLQCQVIEQHVFCKLDDDTWATIENEPISVPWGVL